MKSILTWIIPLFSLPSWLIAIFAVITTMFAPIALIIHTILFLIIIDNITGIAKSVYITHGEICIFCVKTWKSIRSDRLGKTIMKMLSYTLLIMSAFLIDEHIIMLSDNWFTKIIAVSISIRELISITENVEQVTGRNLLSTIVNVIKKGWKKGFEDEINKNRKP